MERTVRVRVAAVDGHCAVHHVGDQFQVTGASLKSTVPVCIHALPSLLHYALAIREGTSPVDLGLAKSGNVARVACPDPGPPLTDGGVVIFEMELVGDEAPARVRHRYVD